MTKKKTEKKKIKKLSPPQEAFCRYFIGVDFNNGTRAYARAYGYENELSEYDDLNELSETKRRELGKQERFEELQLKYNNWRAAAPRLLTLVSVERRVNELLLETFDENKVDAEHAWVIKQKRDLPSKIAAIREFNKLKGRITDKVKVTNTFSLSDILDEVDK